MFRPSTFLPLFVAFSVLLQGRQDAVSCGTYPERTLEELSLHEQSLVTGKARLRLRPLAAGESLVQGRSVLPDQGQIAILDDADGVVSRRNAFNLDQKTIVFTRINGAARYRYEVQGPSVNSTSGTVLNLGDDDTRVVTLPFAFPFYGATHNSVNVNSDGNLTFAAGDGSSADRSLGRMNAGPPRIAGLYRDLDPTKSRDGVKVDATPQRAIFTWSAVPEYQDSGTGRPQTFQIRLFPDGKIELAFGGVTTTEAVVGIAPGTVRESLAVVDFATQPSGEYTGAVAERFSSIEGIDIFTAAQKFFLNHDDAYDYVVLFNNQGIPADTGAVAYEVTVRNNRTGYGDTKTDTGAEAGSRRRLQSIMNMGPLDQYPPDPTGIVPARFTARDTPLTVIGHEAGHLFLAFASIRDPANPSARPMLGRQTAHWAFTFNSEASLLEGNRIQDSGEGVSPRFRTVATVEGYSPLDQYLMGFRPPDQVPDTFLVQNSTLGTANRGPQSGVTFDGQRRNVSVNEIIQVEGRRTPDSTVAQRRFRFAFVLITAAGQTPTALELAQLDRYRTDFENFYARASSFNATADTSLKKALQVSISPAAGVIEGQSGTGKISLDEPTPVPLTIGIRSKGLLRVPSTVTIPANSSSADFTLAGLSRGVDELQFEPADSQYETVAARTQVAAAQDVVLQVVAGDNQAAQAGVPLAQPVIFRATDVNELPYPGVTLNFTVTGGGSISPSTVVTDASGLATVRWVPGPGDFNEIRASVAGGSSIAATTIGTPLFSTSNVLNAATFKPGLAAGGIGTVFGANLSNAQVLLNGSPVRVFYSDARQVNFAIPSSARIGAGTLTIRTTGGMSAPVAVTIDSYAPGVFFDAGSGNGAIIVRERILEVYATGLGPTLRQTSGLEETTVKPLVLIDGRTAEVLFSGLAPGFEGLYQVNVRVPDGLPAGSHTLSVSAGGKPSNDVKVSF